MLFKILFSLFFFAAAVHALDYNCRVFVHRDNKDLDEPLCLVVRGIGKTPRSRWVSVSSYQDVDECARFLRTDLYSSYQFQEQTTGKLMSHRHQRIYLDGEPGDETPQTRFFMPSANVDAVYDYLKPADAANTTIYAEYPSGEINTKNVGEPMYISLTPGIF